MPRFTVFLRTRRAFCACILGLSVLVGTMQAQPASGPIDPAKALSGDPLFGEYQLRQRGPGVTERAREPSVNSGLLKHSEKPLGVWRRSVKSGSIEFRIEQDHLKAIIIREDGKRRLKVDFRADYALSKDGVLFGLVTSAAADGGKGDDAFPLADVLTIEKALIDAPFSIRFRVDGDTLTVKDFRIGVLGGQLTEEELPLYMGRYQKHEKRSGEKHVNRERPRTKVVTVLADGEHIRALAARFLSDANRWPESYRLNPMVDPARVIPGGTKVEVPIDQ